MDDFSVRYFWVFFEDYFDYPYLYTEVRESVYENNKNNKTKTFLKLELPPEFNPGKKDFKTIKPPEFLRESIDKEEYKIFVAI